MFGDTSMQSQQQAKRGEDFIPTNLPFRVRAMALPPRCTNAPEVARNMKLKETKKAAAKKKRRYSPMKHKW
ncbi:hypothetical protein NL676_019638 [Syzygium grande]|nr:hypothetical protein NL676_019638 [Syzygium grande]